jgi:tripartite-type tricarboxylate transporter receptor subunit TctC
MMHMNLFKLIFISLAGMASLSSSAAYAQASYPNKPITFVVPYGAGGGADSRSRQIAQKMSVILKQPIIVDNKPGAGGNIGTEYISRAAPDG